MNKVTKGRRIEATAAGLLETTHVVHRVVRNVSYRGGRHYSNRIDILGCIDIIAKPRQRSDDERTRWIQVTAGRDIGRKIHALEQIPWAQGDSVEIWRWVGGMTRGRQMRPGGLYFQVYRRETRYIPDAADRVYMNPAAVGD